MTARPTAMPMAATGPRPDVEFIAAARRQSMPATTVAPLAKIAGPARCSAKAMASWRSWWRLSSSRYRATSEQGVVGARTEDENTEDALRLRVHGETGMGGEQVDDRLCGEERDARPRSPAAARGRGCGR